MPKYTHQESFNMLVAYAATMTEQSIDKGRCKYRKRDEQGNVCNKCFIGGMILDEYYCPRMESNTARSNLVIEGLESSGHDGRAPFWEEAQVIHDCQPVRSWKGELQNLAKQYDLQFPEDVEFPVLLPQ